jgi:hypothetical protein
MRRRLEWLHYIDFYYLAKRVGCQVCGFLSMISTAEGLSKLTLMGSSDLRYGFVLCHRLCYGFLATTADSLVSASNGEPATSE